AQVNETGEIDLTAPVLTINPIGATNDETPVINGTSDLPVGTSIQVNVIDASGNEQIVSTLVDAQGNWQIELAQLAEGEFNIQAKALDDAGNEQIVQATGIIDTQAPEIFIDEIGLVNDPTPLISGTSNALAGSVIEIVIIDANEITQIITTTVSQSGTWLATTQSELAEGEFDVQANVIDQAGNVASYSVTGELDTTAPGLVIDSFETTTDSTPLISGSSDMASGTNVEILITDNNGVQHELNTQVVDGGLWQVELNTPLAEGRFSVNAIVIDDAGNQSSAGFNALLDSQAPSLEINELVITNDQTPSIGGTSDVSAGRVVNIEITDSIGEVEQYTAVVDAQGQWQFNVNHPLAEGIYTVNANVADSAGNITQITAQGEIDITGHLLSINSITDPTDPTPIISGSSDAPQGTLVEIKIIASDLSEQLLTTSVDQSGNWQITSAQISDGEFTATASIADSVGNTTSTTMSGIIDTTAPDISINELGVSSDNTPQISGTSNMPAGTQINVNVIDAEGQSQALITSVKVDGSWLVEVPAGLAEGEFQVNANISDDNGNQGVATANGVVDTQAPVISINPIGLINDNTPIISGDSDLVTGSEINITVTDAENNSQIFTTIIEEDGSWFINVTSALADGDFTINAQAEDLAGNSGQTQITAQLDTQAPTLNVTSGLVINDNTPVITGTTNAGEGQAVTVSLLDSNGQNYTIISSVNASGQWAVEFTDEIPDGSFTIQASVSDAAGNQTQVTESGEINTQAPEVSVSVENLTNDNTPLISGSSNQIGRDIQISVSDSNGDTQNLTANVSNNGTWQVVPNTLVDGTFTVKVSITDEFGNTAESSASGVIDTIAYQLSLDAIGVINDLTPTFSGSSNAPENTSILIEVTDASGTIQSFSSVIANDGSWQASVPANMAEGSFSVSVEISDGANNITSVNATGTLDTTAATINILNLNDTNDVTPLVQGTSSVANGEVVVRFTDSSGDPGLSVSVLTDGNGNWQAEAPSDLAEGLFTVQAEVTFNGKTSTTSATANIDITPPVLQIDTLNPTNDTTPTIKGFTDEPSGSQVLIRVTDAESNIYDLQATVNASGGWSANVSSELVEGNFSIQASITDVAGNQTQAISSGFIDLTQPNLTINELGMVNTLMPLVTGTSDLTAGATINLTIIDSLGNEFTRQTQVDADGNWNYQLDQELEEGEFSIEASAADNAGNITTAINNGIIDITAPELSINPIGNTNDTTPLLSGTTNLDAGSTISITVIDANTQVINLNTTVQPNGTWSVEVTQVIAQGEFNVQAEAVDGAGNQTTKSSTGFLDLTAPTLTIDDIGQTNDITPIISGQTNAESGQLVQVTLVDSNNQSQSLTATVQNDGSWWVETKVALADGEFTITANVSDLAGNITTETLAGVIDTQAALITLNNLTDGNDSTPLLSGTSDLPAGETISVTITDSQGVTQNLTAVTQTNGNWSVEPNNVIADGHYVVNIHYEDEAGNETFINSGALIDTVAPNLTINSIGAINDTTPNISGSSDAITGSQVQLTITDINGVVQTITTSVSNGNWNINTPSPLAEGEFTVTASISDQYNNQATVQVIGEVDTTPPVINVNALGSTQDTTPILSGTSDLPENATLSLIITDRNGSSQTLTTQVDSNGNWSVEAEQALAEGEYSVTVTGIDSAGNETDIQATGKVDLTAPSLTINALSASNDSTPELSGSSNEIGAVIYITVTDSQGVTQSFSTTVTSNGSWLVDVPQPLADGNYNVNAQVQDAANNQASVSRVGTIDTTAPSLSINELGLSNDSTPLINGTTNAVQGQVINLVIVDSNNIEHEFFTQVNADGTWSYEVTDSLPDGEYTVTVYVSDVVGNQATTTAIGQIDTLPPELEINNIGHTNDSTPLLSGTTTAEVNTLVNLYIEDADGQTQIITAVVNESGQWQQTVGTPLAEGSFSVEATVNDLAGNQTVTNSNGTIDLTDPEIRIDTIGETNDTTPLISGVSSAPVGQTINLVIRASTGEEQAITTQIQSDNSWQVEVEQVLTEGSYTVIANVADLAGNEAIDTKSFVVDITPPTITISSTGAENDNTPVISGSSDVAVNTIVTVVLVDSNNESQTITTQIDIDGNWSVEAVNPLSEGTFTVQASVSDTAGNESSATTSGNVDTTNPILTLDLDANLDTINSIISNTLSGTTEPNAQVYIRVGNAGNELVGLQVATADEDGNFSIPIDADLLSGKGIQEGDLVIEAQVTDAAGNSSIVDLEAVLDITPPELTLSALDVVNSVVSRTFSGVTEPGAQVNIRVGNSGEELVELQVVIADEDGNFSIPIDADLLSGKGIQEGDLVIEATASDRAGNISVLDINAVLDITAPSLSLDPLGGVISSTLTQTLSG
ncbi:Ig-like domain-containing protein, partial [Catenovulum sp. 2E275]|uniref:Ig-like domain-containing protein n=1 Tax=Catenovulum sp. 2E275 TaxID=2980497 RepID=UPI0021D1EFFC